MDLLTNQVDNIISFPFNVKVPKNSVLQKHQYIIKEFINVLDTRGLLVYHGMGSGKTFVAAAVCEEFIKKKYSVVFMSAKSLHENFRRTVLKYNKNANEKKYTFVSINASNMITQVAKASDKIEALLNKNLIPNLNRKVVVVDEAHNFFNSIANGSKNAQLLYHAIMKSNCKVLFLTGTPIINDPFEAALCFNMLNGPIGEKNQTTTLFPESYAKFNEYFILKKNNTKYFINVEVFQRRIFGLISYFPLANSELMPKELSPIFVYCEMSSPQFHEYIEYQKIEQNSIRKKSEKTFNLTKEKKSASYRVMTRQICNFFYPDKAAEFLVGERGQRIKKGKIELLKDDDLEKNLNIYSPKIFSLMENLNKEGVHLVYSQFLNYGLKVIEKLLLIKKIKYALISGEVEKEKIADLVEMISSEKNINGDVYKVVLISSTASEGVSFNNIRHVHVLEYYWTASKIKQIIYRGIRFGSHVNLPEKERFIQPYFYMATHKTYTEGQTTDEYLYEKATEKQKLIDKFLDVIKSTAIDCHLYKDSVQKCFYCHEYGDYSPTELYLENIESDILRGSVCGDNYIDYVYINSVRYIIEKNAEEYIVYEEIIVDVWELVIDEEKKKKVLVEFELQKK